ncbi:hypothetical protein MKZ38_005651 [Zalerion maritima]|uniref:Wax synthase domain-containing protein n=1 Tax=Zalerion maritima TaxID=339359 RepID=A0AAD5WWJ4_9PEZI|nr:hypothetical protein MKZ38_005651 [Zalerion maritima]
MAAAHPQHPGTVSADANLSPAPATAILELAERARVLAEFLSRRSSGDVRPLVVPYSVLGTFVVPILYFAFPHTTPTRRWLFRARWLVFIAIVLFNLDLMRSTSSANFATAYAAGLLGSWGIMWGATVLVFTRPQFEYELISRRRRQGQGRETRIGLENGGCNSHAGGERGDWSKPDAQGQGQEPNSKPEIQMDRLDEDVKRSLSEGYEYYWQPYPADAPFLDRLRWSINLSMSFRGAGWNYAIATIPRPLKPSRSGSREVVRMDTIPIRAHTGVTRCLTRREFFAKRLTSIIIAYLCLDFLAVLMMKDPYFILGDPDQSHPALSPFLLSMPYSLLCLYRYFLVMVGVWSALLLMFSLHETVQLLATPWLLGPTQAELWQYPSVYGSAQSILDRGLLGFWGGFWHQTFRHSFTAPLQWFFGGGAENLKKRSASSQLVRATALFVALGVSGLLHAAGSYTAVRETTAWKAPAFFLASAVGMVVQTALAGLLRPVVAPRSFPRFVRKAANVAFAVGWTYWTAAPLADDFSESGIWLYEPVPFSPLRALGFGHPGDRAWRHRWGQLPYLWKGGRWWESGLAI